MSKFRVLDVSIDFAASCEKIASALRRRGCDKPLASQLSRAADSVALNLAEGVGVRGARRMYHYRIALGSGREAVTGIRLAIAKNRVSATNADVLAALKAANIICGTLYKLTR